MALKRYGNLLLNPDMVVFASVHRALSNGGWSGSSNEKKYEVGVVVYRVESGGTIQLDASVEDVKLLMDDFSKTAAGK